MSFGTTFSSYEELIANDLEPGDLIEINRGLYSHWVMFVNKCKSGMHWCFHAVATDDNAWSGSMMSSEAIIRKDRLEDIMEGNDSARINNKIDEAKRKECVHRPVNVVITNLERQKDKTVRYSLVELNCEHYVTIWKYGAGWSRQVENAHYVIDSVLGGIARIFGC
ncbi:hypothetical protein HA402_012961 [Bradysia odoriphaga]|nr:hypothetical protein HA402_012961 [Bradysia odoriphaga]